VGARGRVVRRPAGPRGTRSAARRPHALALAANLAWLLAGCAQPVLRREAADREIADGGFAGYFPARAVACHAERLGTQAGARVAANDLHPFEARPRGGHLGHLGEPAVRRAILDSLRDLVARGGA